MIVVTCEPSPGLALEVADFFVPAPRRQLATASLEVTPSRQVIYFYAGYAVHSMTSVPAYPASHGCVRMTVPAMDCMWSSLWVGMPVAIYSS